MTGADELRKRREQEALKIRTALNRQRGEQRANTKGGEGTVAFVEERKCIGCDQCTISTGICASLRMWLVAPPKIICRNRLCV